MATGRFFFLFGNLSNVLFHRSSIISSFKCCVPLNIDSKCVGAHLISVQNVPSLTAKLDNVSETFVGYSFLSLSEPLWRPQYFMEATLPQRVTGFVKVFHFQTHHIKLQTTDPLLAQLCTSKETSPNITLSICVETAWPQCSYFLSHPVFLPGCCSVTHVSMDTKVLYL